MMVRFIIGYQSRDEAFFIYVHAWRTVTDDRGHI